jgi:hypothetical protein
MKYLAILIIPMMLLGCYESDLGYISTKQHNLSAFQALQHDGLGDVYIHPADYYSLEVKTHDDIQKDIIFYVENGTLRLDEEVSNRKENSIDRLELHVFVPTLTDIELNGVGNITCPSGFSNYRLNINSDGVGNIEIRNLDLERLIVRHDGVGDIRISGDAAETDYYLKEVGNIYGFSLRTEICYAELSGVGNIETWTVDRLHAHADGVGNIYYTGNPEVTKFESGTSKVINAN